MTREEARETLIIVLRDINSDSDEQMVSVSPESFNSAMLIAIDVLNEPFIPPDVDEAADKHIRRVVDAAGHPGWDWTTQDIAEAFKAGVAYDRTKMLKEAVEADVNTYELTPGGSAYVEFVADMPVARFRSNDKVRIIVLKEEEE